MPKKYKTGITVGVFDLFHVGHLNLLERCKALCEHLIVAVCQDDYVAQVERKSPVYCAGDRMRILAALKCVDEVIPVTIEETEDKLLLIQNHPFDVLFSGDDWKGSPRYMRTEEQFALLGAHIEYLPYTQGISTTQIKQMIGGGVMYLIYLPSTGGHAHDGKESADRRRVRPASFRAFRAVPPREGACGRWGSTGCGSAG